MAHKRPITLDEGKEYKPPDPVLEAIKLRWESEQRNLQGKISLEDDRIVKEMLSSSSSDTFYVGGMDISFFEGDNVNACAALVVCSYPDLEVVYEDYKMIELTQPYIPGFLAFREIEFMKMLYENVREKNPKYTPQVIMVDGNGILHPRGLGSASHLGVILNVPCVGVAKNLFCMENEIERDEQHKEQVASLKKAGDTFPLVGSSSGICYGKALRSCEKATNPVYVSPGHGISVDSAVELVYRCSKYRVPQPIRHADLNSREYIRVRAQVKG
uniref:Endonuclease V-like n=1 Tax=Crassostrea virginica TaxID=6565 RepID=A0A8B8D1J5_CRAVI|nr:endonuclease V-like [Crassostrea virginica]